jgi:CO/xanthine dehydrogenase Mo-binding subunit
MDGPAPAIANAVRQALSVDVDRLPLFPEYLLDRLTSHHKDVA